MRHRAGQFDMAHTLTAHFRQSNLDAAFLTNDTAVLQALVLSAQTLIVLDGPENLGAE